MKTNNTHYYVNRHRQRKKPRHRLLFGGLLGAILLFIGLYIIASSGKGIASPPAKETQPSVASLAKNIQLTWPATGQAAFGSVEDGLLEHSSNNEEPHPTASMAKIITALAILEKQPLAVGEKGPSYTVTSEDVANYRAYVAKGGSVLPVHVGMILTQYQALEAMLIPSANNMADMLVERVFGSKEAYLSYAQKMIRRMELSQTVVTDPSGFDPTTVSTPSELVRIGIAALKNPVIAKIVAQPKVEIPDVGIVKNTNELLGVNGVVGIKTGTTNSAGSCLLFAAHYVAKEGRAVTVLGVIMGDTDTASLFSDSTNLLMSARQAYSLVEV